MNEHTYIHLHIRRNMVAIISIVSSKLDDGEAIEICQILIGRYFHWSKDYPICSIFSTELKFIGYVFFPCILNMTKAYAECGLRTPSSKICHNIIVQNTS